MYVTLLGPRGPLQVYCRAIATNLVSPVSTGPLFPSLMACLVSPISAIAQWMPMARTQRDLLSTRWLQTVWKNLFRVFQQLSILPSKRLVLQASPVIGVACEVSKRSESQNQCYMAQQAERGRYSCTSNSVVWPLRSIILGQKWSQKQSHSL